MLEKVKIKTIYFNNKNKNILEYLVDNYAKKYYYLAFDHY